MTNGVLKVPEELSGFPDAITVRNAFKSYGSGKKTCPVLHNYEMTVKQGSLYALLGASGCGKTTLLSCVVGRHHLDSGDIRIFGHAPGTKEAGVPGSRIGYMPQEIALYLDTSIEEMLQYFGLIHHMSKHDRSMQIAFLLKFLQLPHKSRLIHTLSGGQQRRVSFAIALLHQPDLLILDEPTVGVDPLLRQTIWSHLRLLAQERQMTVLLTTHYIEEARQAQMTGMMRSGHLLAQDSPEALLTQYQFRNLEDVFLTLCLHDDRKDVANDGASEVAVTPMQHNRSVSNRAQMHSNNNNVPKPQFLSSSLAKSNPSVLAHARAVFYKNWKRLLRKKETTVMFTLLPPALMLLFCMFLGGDPKALKLAVVNNEWPSDPICQPYDDCLFVNLSCRYLHTIDQDMVQLIPYKNDDSAVEAVSRGDVWGVISFPEDYSDSLSNRFIEGDRADNHTLMNSKSILRMDMTNQQIGFILQRMLVFRFGQLINDLVTLCDIPKELAEPPLNFGDPIFGTNKPLFQEFMAPGMLLCITFGLSLAMCSGMLVAERQEGVVQRALASGVSSSQILFGQMVVQLFFFIIQLIGMYVVIYFYVGLPLNASIVWNLLLAMMQCGCGISCGFLLAIFASNMTFLVVLIFSWFFPAFIMSSTLWPLEGIHHNWLRIVCLGFPTTWATEAARSMAMRGWGLFHNGVWPGFVSTVVWTAFFTMVTLLCIRLFKRNPLVQ